MSAPVDVLFSSWTENTFNEVLRTARAVWPTATVKQRDNLDYFIRWMVKERNERFGGDMVRRMARN